MVVISDLHDHEFGKDNEKLIRCVKEQDPEMIILDGDMLNEDSKRDVYKRQVEDCVGQL